MKFSNFTKASKIGIIISIACVFIELLIILMIIAGLIKGIGKVLFILPIIGGIACVLVFIILASEFIRYSKNKK